MSTFTAKKGFGQVEPNHLSAQRTSQIYAQLPAAEDIDVLENGQYVKYDYANKQVNFTGAGEWMMVFNEIKLYDDHWRESYADYAMQKKDFNYGIITPRVIKTNNGDIYTTNTIAEGATITKGSLLAPNAEKKGFLDTAKGDETSVVWQVVEDDATMPDGKPACKLMRIK